jgi:hypothetical protein
MRGYLCILVLIAHLHKVSCQLDCLNVPAFLIALIIFAINMPRPLSDGSSKQRQAYLLAPAIPVRVVEMATRNAKRKIDVGEPTPEDLTFRRDV